MIQYLTLENIIPLAVFLTITLGVWGLLSAIADRPVDPEDRLRRVFFDPAARKAEASLRAHRQERLHAKVAEAAKRLGESVRPSDEVELGKLRVKLLNAGYRSEHAVVIYCGLKLLCLLAGVALSVPLVASHYGLTTTALTRVLLAGGLGFYLPDIIVNSLAKRRAEAIFLSLPDALDLMVVCVEAGLGLDAAMRRVTTELQAACPVLCDEFAIANFQLQMGRARKDVLRELGVRTGVEDVRALAAVIIQAEKFGSSIGAALRVQSDAMRTRRRQLAEERAAKTAVKIMIPLVLFIFPGVFVVLVGPAGIQIAKTLLGK